jgi:hypothetical protein
MADKKVSVQVGPNFLGLLTIVFITIKLTGYIIWSWLWVLAPLWGGFAAVFLIMALVFLVVLIRDARK